VDPQHRQTLLAESWNEALGHAWEKQPYYLKRRSHMASVALQGDWAGSRPYARLILHTSYTAYRVVCGEARSVRPRNVWYSRSELLGSVDYLFPVLAIQRDQ
jgi:hypothetical protein